MALRPRQRPGFLRKGHFSAKTDMLSSSYCKITPDENSSIFSHTLEDGRARKSPVSLTAQIPTRELGYHPPSWPPSTKRGFQSDTPVSSGKEEGLYVWEGQTKHRPAAPASPEGLPADTGSWPEENNRILNKLGADVQIDRPAAFHEETALSQLKVKKHLCTRRGGSSVLLVVQNLSDYLLRLNVSFSAYDANGNELAAQEAAAPAFESRSETGFLSLTVTSFPHLSTIPFRLRGNRVCRRNAGPDLATGKFRETRLRYWSATPDHEAEYLVADILFYQGIRW